MWELDYKESWAPKNWCFWTVVLEKTLDSPLDSKEIQPVHPKGDQSWVFIGRTDVEAETPNILAAWCEELTHLKRPWCWERLKAGEVDDRGWDGWMASPTQCTWAGVNSRSWWWTGRLGVLRIMGSQTVRHDWATTVNWTELPRAAASPLKVIPAMLKECWNLSQKTWVLVLSKHVISVIFYNFCNGDTTLLKFVTRFWDCLLN